MTCSIRHRWNYIVSVEEQETQQSKFNHWKGDYNKINADLESYDWEKNK